MAVLQLLNATFVLIVAGQSNTHYGAMLERSKDDLDFSRVLQIPSQGNPQLTLLSCALMLIINVNYVDC